MIDTYLTENFKISDLTVTNTGIPNTVAESAQSNLAKLAEVLELIKEYVGDFWIASAYRNEAVNKAVGGSSTSRHKYGEAADIAPTGMSPEAFWVELIANPLIKERLGEISLKKHQNTIHLSLPYYNTYGYCVKGSPRVADKDITGKVTYRSLTSSEVENYLNKYGLLEMAKSAQQSIVKTMSEQPVLVGLGVLALGGGLLLVSMAARK